MNPYCVIYAQRFEKEKIPEQFLGLPEAEKPFSFFSPDFTNAIDYSATELALDQSSYWTLKDKFFV